MRYFLCGLATLAFLSAPGARSAEPGLSPDEEKAIRATSADYVSAMRANEWQEVASFFTADATRMPPNQPMHKGRDAIEQWLGQVDELRAYSVTLEEIHGAGGMAYARATYTITLTLKGMVGPITDSGKAIEVWKKEPDGRWRIASAIWNSDLPLP